MAFGGHAMGTKRQLIGPPATGLLDIYSGALFAFSTGRRLRDAYAGALFRVRRSSDNAEQDIGFNSGTGLVDTAALTSFVGANSGFIATLYDQSLNVRDAIQATAANQPAIVVAGVVQTMGTNARPAPLWDDTDDLMSTGTFTIGSDECLAYWACRNNSHATYGTIFQYGDGANGSGEFTVNSPEGDAIDAVGFYNNSASVTTRAIAAAPLTYLGRVRGKLTSGSTLRNIRVSKSAESTGTTTSAANYGTAKALRIGNRSDLITPYAGTIGELILFNTIARAATDGIDDNMMTFWGIT